VTLEKNKSERTNNNNNVGIYFSTAARYFYDIWWRVAIFAAICTNSRDEIDRLLFKTCKALKGGFSSGVDPSGSTTIFGSFLQPKNSIFLIQML